jgi:diadenosine tetraphosphatase ApaH/serine/threonine PP2A family protein phosphatase
MKYDIHSIDPMSYDIIGDIHGQADKLEALLVKLGYRNTAHVWRHPERQAIFLGDFVDLGPAQVRSIDTVRRMVEAGSALAVMGNHELNAIAWHTENPRQPGEYLRQHFSPKWGEKNRKQHAAFLAEVEDRPTLHTEIIDWFLTLPLWLDLPGLRVVHACWHGPFLTWLSPHLRDARYLTRELMVPATDEPENEVEKDNSAPSVFKAVEVLTKGIEVPLPVGYRFHDKYGQVRERVRVRWWDEGAITYRSAAMLSPSERAALPDLPIPEHARVDRATKPVFFGHYWLTGVPSLQSSRAACVDYSAGIGGALVAYRFDGEPDLSTEHFIWVD